MGLRLAFIIIESFFLSQLLSLIIIVTKFRVKSNSQSSSYIMLLEPESLSKLLSIIQRKGKNKRKEK